MVFNLTGYRALFGYLENLAQVKMQEKLDKSAYNPNNLIEVKIALHLPYTTDNKDFERYDGTVELNGTTYSYVERKVENDTLILHCLPNKNSDNIKFAFNEYGKAVNDAQTAQKGQKGNAAALLLKALAFAGCKTHNEYNHYNTFFTTQLSAYKAISESVVSKKFAKSPEQPPDVA